MSRLTDSFGRQFQYLRLSVTEACNFRCSYCLPSGFSKDTSCSRTPLSLGEISLLTRVFSELGVFKVRLTGGEPTVRSDIVSIVEGVASTPGLKEIALTTNGYRLYSLAADLKRVGLTALNVSVDSLNPETFRAITGHAKLANVLAGIDAALSAGIREVKLNTVVLKGINDHEVVSFLQWVKSRPVTVRFIELMRTGDNQELFSQRHTQLDTVINQMLARGWRRRNPKPGAGPAVEMENPDYLGRIGFISPYSKDFCAHCNRLRVTSSGELRMCLFGEENFPLRPWLRDEQDPSLLHEKLNDLLRLKPKSHRLHEARFGNANSLSAMGG